MREICWLFKCPERDGCIYRQQEKPCRNPQHCDDWFDNLLKNVRAKPNREAEPIRFCPHCGRKWEGSFYHLYRHSSRSIDTHMALCSGWGIPERRRRSRIAEKRWATSPNGYLTTTVDWGHPGMNIQIETDWKKFTFEDDDYLNFMPEVGIKPRAGVIYECPVCGEKAYDSRGRANKHWMSHKDMPIFKMLKGGGLEY